MGGTHKVLPFMFLTKKMAYKRYKMLQKYVNGEPVEEYKQGELMSSASYDGFSECDEGNTKPGEHSEGKMYEWRNVGTVCDEWQKYRQEEQYYSVDGGVNWIASGYTRKGDLISSCSDDCGATQQYDGEGHYIYDCCAFTLVLDYNPDGLHFYLDDGTPKICYDFTVVKTSKPDISISIKKRNMEWIDPNSSETGWDDTCYGFKPKYESSELECEMMWIMKENDDGYERSLGGWFKVYVHPKTNE